MGRKHIFLFLLAAIVLALVLSPFASTWPDGLERVAEDKGFMQKDNTEPIWRSSISAYMLRGVKNEKVATALASALGTLLVFGTAYGLAALLRAAKHERKHNAS